MIIFSFLLQDIIDNVGKSSMGDIVQKGGNLFFQTTPKFPHKKHNSDSMFISTVTNMW
ncbi:hypothetical protein D3C87_1677890 [compost metagenome]